jgi:hypothetical protein
MQANQGISMIGETITVIAGIRIWVIGKSIKLSSLRFLSGISVL